VFLCPPSWFWGLRETIYKKERNTETVRKVYLHDEAIYKTHLYYLFVFNNMISSMQNRNVAVCNNMISTKVTIECIQTYSRM
jgi:hypothetical protein